MINQDVKGMNQLTTLPFILSSVDGREQIFCSHPKSESPPHIRIMHIKDKPEVSYGDTPRVEQQTHNVVIAQYRGELFSMFIQ